jgi:L-asparaginase II
MSRNDYEPILEITRGKIVESIHFGAMAVVDAEGKLVSGFGNTRLITYLRSSAKPFQALPFVERGGVEHFGLSPRELALICASHSGTDEHLRVVTEMQKKIGIQESDLQCGTHPVSDEPTLEEMIRHNEQPRPNRHNCSGKHTGMLAHARLRGLPLEGYIDAQHEVQKTILRVLAEMCEMEPDDVVVGIDGCSVPTFAVPLRNAAHALAKLCDPSALSSKRSDSCRKIAEAMTGNPDMVAGPGRFDTHLMLAGRGKILSKGGAEGYQAIGLLPGALGDGSPAMGIAFKISDGDLGGHVRPTFPGISSDSRARAIVAMSILKQLGALDAKQVEELKNFDARPIRNWRKVEVGEYRTTIHI